MKYLSSLVFAAPLLAAAPPSPSMFCNLPSATPPCVTWMADASLLAWQALEDGLDLAFHNSPRFAHTQYGTPPIQSDLDGSLLGMDFDWMPGYKVLLGMDFPEKRWGTLLRWTSFYSRSEKSYHAQASLSGAGLFPVWLIPSASKFIPQIYSATRGIWNLRFQTVDWELTSHLFLNSPFSLRLLGGVKALLIEQIFRVKYTGGIASIPSEQFRANDSDTRIKNKTLGLGPRLGCAGKWRLGRGWSLCAELAGALPLYLFDLKRLDTASVTHDTDGTTFFQSKYKEAFWAYRPSLETLAGLSWEACLGQKRSYFVGFDAAYELQHYWEQNTLRLLASQTLYFAAFPERGNLTLHGVTATFRLGF